MAAAHVAARRAHRSANCWLSDLGGRALEDGHLWIAAIQFRVVPERVAPIRAGDDYARRDWHHLWRAGGDGATGRQTSGRILVSQSHGFRRARPLFIYRAG